MLKSYLSTCNVVWLQAANSTADGKLRRERKKRGFGDAPTEGRQVSMDYRPLVGVFARM